MTPSFKSISKDTFEASRRPFAIRATNKAGDILRWLGVRIDLSENKLSSAALTKEKASNFSDDSFHEPFSVLLDSLDNEASLTFVGRFMARQMLISALVNRLRIESESLRRAESLETPIEQPLFIVGYPRTGTTLLHNLLSLDTQSRTVKMYEALSPVPAKPADNRSGDPRIDTANKFIRAAHYLSAQVPVIHALTAEGPDECLKLIENTFVSPHFLLYYHAPGYWRWLQAQESNTFVAVYQYHRRQLQLLGRGKGGLRWVLKAPVHMYFLDALLKVYPDARIVFLHRDPFVAIPSFCSLLAVSRSMASDTVDLAAIGEFSVELYDVSYRRALQAREAAANPGQFYDIEYDHLVKDPVATLRGIYRYFGLSAAADIEVAIRKWLTDNPQHKHGMHRYSMEKFGLDRRRINQVTGRFNEAGHFPSATFRP